MGDLGSIGEGLVSSLKRWGIVIGGIIAALIGLLVWKW
jgi:hypothetical protein